LRFSDFITRAELDETLPQVWRRTLNELASVVAAAIERPDEERLIDAAQRGKRLIERDPAQAPVLGTARFIEPVFAVRFAQVLPAPGPETRER
jgi:hypothetical protein